MTRRVVQSSEVYHLWAHQAQGDARNSGGSVSFSGEDAYSYRAQIGRIVTNSDGERAYLVSTHKYSITTSGHQSALRQAIPEGRTAFYVPVIDSPARMLTAMMEEIDVLARLAAKSRALRFQRIQELHTASRKVRQIAAFFGLPQPVIPDYNLDELKGQISAADKARKEAEEKAALARLVAGREIVDRWIAGEYVAVPYGMPTHFLRLCPSDALTAETSMGARVPSGHIIRAMPLVLRLIGQAISEKQVIQPSHDIRLGHYRLDRIDADGAVRVGCHRFGAEEVRRFAAVLLEPDMDHLTESATAA